MVYLVREILNCKLLSSKSKISIHEREKTQCIEKKCLEYAVLAKYLQ